MIKIVIGPPASGKTSYVKKHMKENDIVYDFDSIMQAITMRKKYDRNNNASYLITNIRSCIIKQHTQIKNKIDDIWIITTNINDKLMKDLSNIDTKDIEYIKIKTPLEECLKRIDKDPARKHIAEGMKDAARKWFDKYQDVDFNKNNKSTYDLIMENLKKQNELLNNIF